MRNHTLIYLNAFGYAPGDFIPSEMSGKKAVDIHHIIGRGKKGEDRIENLMAVTREEHILYGDHKQSIAFLFKKHREYLEANGVRYNKKWMQQQIDKYEVFELSELT